MYSKKDFRCGDFVQLTYHNTVRRGFVERVNDNLVCLSNTISGKTTYKSFCYDKMSDMKILAVNLGV